jgi:hypothetical protein
MTLLSGVYHTHSGFQFMIRLTFYTKFGRFVLFLKKCNNNNIFLLWYRLAYNILSVALKFPFFAKKKTS